MVRLFTTIDIYLLTPLKIIIYNCNKFIVQATLISDIKLIKLIGS
jgi:hypothetical protein